MLSSIRNYQLHRLGRSTGRGAVMAMVGLAAALAMTVPETGVAGPAGGTDMRKAVRMMQSLDQTRGYLDAHKAVKKPLGLLGGPVKVKIRQRSGGVLVALPDHRKLDPTVFGPPNLPRHYAGTPIITGVPPLLRVKTKDGTYETKVLTPFGNKYIALPNGNLNIEAVDATATDAATTTDAVRMMASWKDAKGNTYEVRCCKKLAAHGLEFPTFGGVVTNTILHGFTGIGTPLMPSEYTYFGFWGFGEVKKNGKTLAKPRLIHGMLTEYVRGPGYTLAWDSGVTPTRWQFHLMVPPMKPDPKNGVFTKSPVPTGFVLPNGKMLPFWHVMFESMTVEASRG